MARRDYNAIDLAQQKLKLADDVLAWPIREAGTTAYRLEIPAVHQFFRVGLEEYTLISLLDGETTLPEACGLTAAKFGSRAPSADQAISIAQWLIENQLAVLEGDESPIRDPKAGKPGENNKTGLLKKLNPFWIKVPLSKNLDILRAISRTLHLAFTPLAVLLGICVMVAGLFTLLAHRHAFLDATGSVISSQNWIWLLVIWLGLKVVHELGHAACCQRFGGQVSELGLVMVLFAPLAYVDVSSSWRMASRWKRIAIAAAGMYVELVIAAIAVFFWIDAESPHARMLWHQLIFAAGVSTLVFNLNALMRFDGYFILSDLVEIPNLYGEATKELKRVAQRYFFGQSQPNSRYAGWRLRFIQIYAISSFGWRMLICVSLLITASAMFSGAGILLALAGILTWFAVPLAKFVGYCFRMQRRDPILAIRGVTLCLLTGFTIIGTFIWVPFPTAVNVPAIVEPSAESLVRAPTSGFVSEVRCRSNQRVRQGQTLLVLENPELKTEIQQLKIELEQNETRQRKAIQEQNPSGLVVLKEQASTLGDQIRQLQEQLDGLVVRSPLDGTVIARNLSHQLGSYVHEGDELLIVGRPSDKEVIALVSHRDLGCIDDEPKQSVLLRSAGFKEYRGTIGQAEPRATNRLRFASLAASNGGPLAIVTDQDAGEQGIRLVEPHFPLRVRINHEHAASIPLGTRLTAFLGYRSLPLATRMRETIHQWWYAAHGET